ncbi:MULTISPECIES: RHS repeat domain-containing protein [unclassified Paenibacillus]|uniref:RHS repeat domain-containing protein n=1 Tax=unclassified Paenibacillus TaxID=185978 RepID=UPI00240610B5|nr:MULTISPECIES: RHS repeat domain-containing protein [unclassified Paenibacillus]MDF9845248.1 YD repeat-containing protein [Paenibacillus sp. PastF-2]MDF9851830.1 YD repeat-containing protein [Paenibacillus sp. PastM-2]MDF9858405.1 YD repeat-containing protein [Paenibacillus sp. PastF-1]MDH6483557.1 YD repeat-containing protein [Paenibacillus sp. PastH-2]MDH6511063.1 YD repeat-containing protein [Paenibacillus sp. PastM-3]
MKKNMKLFNIIIIYLVVSLGFPQYEAFAAENALVVKENFETGTYTGSNYIPVSGTITNDPLKVVNGKYSALLSAQSSEVWKEFNHSDPAKVKFEKNTTYNVTFSYKSIEMQPQDPNRFFYFLARSTDGKEDKGYFSWNDASGSAGTRTITLTTGNKDNYYLIWGIHAGGSLSIDDIQIVKQAPSGSESFEKGTFTQTNFLAGSGSITNDPTKIISGQYSAFLSSLQSETWKEFAYTDSSKVKFEKNTTYQVTFKYKSISMVPNDSSRYFYFLARSQDNTEDKGWTTWNDISGSSGSKVITFTTGAKENYYLIWGICNGGALSIDDIDIIKISESFEKGSFTDTYFRAGSGILTKEPDKVISGQYSAYLSSTVNEDWKEFAYSNPDKYIFEGNTTYNVTFSFKSLDMDSSDTNRYFYFLARSTDNQEDKGWTTWSVASGNKGKKTITFTTGTKENYYLIWGIHKGGAISLDDIVIRKVSESFERGTFSSTGLLPDSGIITKDPLKVATGMFSAYLNSAKTIEWANIAVTDTSRVKFLKNTTYTVSFSYKSIDMQPEDINRHFYFFARGIDNVEVLGWTSWNDVSGTKGIKTVTFTTGNQDNYYLLWGIRNGGALSIDDIVIQQLTTYEYDADGRLAEIRYSDNRVVKYKYDLNGNLIKAAE